MSRLPVVLPPGAGGARLLGQEVSPPCTLGPGPAAIRIHWLEDKSPNEIGQLGWAGLGWAGKQIHLAALGGVMDQEQARTAAIC